MNCLSCDLADIAKELTIRGLRCTWYATVAAAGISAITISPLTGGLSLAGLKSIWIGTNAFVSVTGTVTKITLDLAGNRELADKMPTDVLSGIVTLACYVFVDDKLVEETIEVGFTIGKFFVEFNYTNPFAIDNIVNVIDAIPTFKQAAGTINTVIQKNN